MNTQEVLQFLYYTVRIPIIFLIIRLIIGILTIFDNKKLDMQKSIYIYYGFVCGGMIGYIMHSSLIVILSCSLFCAMVMFILKMIDKKNQVLQFIMIFSGIYMFIDFIINLFKVDFENMLNIYGDLLVNNTNIYIKLLISFVISIICTIIFLKKKIIIPDLYLKGFIGSLFIVTPFFTDTGSIFYMTGGYIDFFIPLLNINFEPTVCILATIIFIIIYIVVLQIMHKRDSIRDDSH